MTKADVIAGSLWQVTVYAAFQRAKVYKKSATDKDRQGVKETLKAEINRALPDYQTKMTGRKHINRLVRTKKRVDQDWSHVLYRREISIGVVQKALNLYLKLMWCSGKIPAPPHWPGDKILIDHLPCKHRVAWTKIRDIQKYRYLIKHLQVLATASKMSLARWELAVYEKR